MGRSRAKKWEAILQTPSNATPRIRYNMNSQVEGEGEWDAPEPPRPVSPQPGAMPRPPRVAPPALPPRPPLLIMAAFEQPGKVEDWKDATWIRVESATDIQDKLTRREVDLDEPEDGARVLPRIVGTRATIQDIHFNAIVRTYMECIDYPQLEERATLTCRVIREMGTKHVTPLVYERLLHQVELVVRFWPWRRFEWYFPSAESPVHPLHPIHACSNALPARSPSIGKVVSEDTLFVEERGYKAFLALLQACTLDRAKIDYLDFNRGNVCDRRAIYRAAKAVVDYSNREAQP